MKPHRSRSYYAAEAQEFNRTPTEAVLGLLASHHNFDLEIGQRNAWQFQITHLKEIAIALPQSFIFLEFSIPRMGKRADVVILHQNIVFVLEYKVGATHHDSAAADQVLDYALDLKNFHEGSHEAVIVPILIATKAPNMTTAVDLWGDGIAVPLRTNPAGTLNCIQDAIQSLSTHRHEPLLPPMTWASSRYKPTPTIVEAAQALYRGHDVREISRSEAGAENLTTTTNYIDEVIEGAKRDQRKAICFVTGVPGSGKTLAGLSLANARMRSHEDEHAVFLSGNGPLVDVLREALAQDEVGRGRQSGRPVRKADAERNAKAFIQNIHHFRDEYLNGEAPIERVVVFDEAQRAWTREQASKFMSVKRDQKDFDQSEPSFLLSVMDRHLDWCVIVCLIGGGQEINTGEAGLGEWLEALQKEFPHWDLHVSDKLSTQDYLGNSLPSALSDHANRSPALHLAVSIRSFRAEALSDFVSAVLDADASRARILMGRLQNFPIVLTRDLEAARTWLRMQARGSERSGLVASSNALRLKPVGIHVKASIDPPTWFLAPKGDVRSSYALEDAGTEFDVQGLELDWVGVCWDANLRFQEGQWKTFRFQGTKWQSVIDPTRAAYLMNSYRVLLTRARQGIVIVVPDGDIEDPTRDQKFYDGAFEFFQKCGVRPI